MAEAQTPTPPFASGPTPEQQRQAAEAAKKSREAKIESGEKAVEDQEKKIAEQNAATEAMQGKPTPTQHECNLANVGALDIDSKEDDGSGPELLPVMTREPREKRDMQSGGSARYKTK